MAAVNEELERAIIVDPEDLTLRLVYADWLEERGDVRGEFIRIGCELADLPDCEFKGSPSDKRCDQTARPYSISCRPCELRRRAEEILGLPSTNCVTSLGTEWALPLYNFKLFMPDWFRCGFIEEVHCRTDEWYGSVCFRHDCFNEEGDSPNPKCELCNGQGVFGGSGPKIVVKLPIRRVHLIDNIGRDGSMLRAFLGSPDKPFSLTDNGPVSWARKIAGLPPLDFDPKKTRRPYAPPTPKPSMSWLEELTGS